MESDDTLNEIQRTAKIASARKRLLRDEVNAKAKELSTCCIHFRPLKSAFYPGLCGLHFATNEFRRFLDKVESIAVAATETLPGMPFFFKQFKSTSQKARICQRLPEINMCRSTHPNAPLLTFVDSLSKIGLVKYSRSTCAKYEAPQIDSSAFRELPGNETEKHTQSKSGKIYRSRLIGENVTDVCIGMPEMLQNLTITKAVTRVDFVTLWSYGHLLRCMISLVSLYVMTLGLDEYGCNYKFVGGLLVKLIYQFSFHHSLSTFYLCKVAAYVINKLKSRMQISPTHCLGMGIWGLLQGREHANKEAKSRFHAWTSGRPGYLKDLLTHFYDVFLGGMYHFKQFCPAVVNLFDADRTSWAKYFSPAETNRCSCCGGEDNDLKPFQESLKSTGELSSLEYDALKLGLSSPYSGTTVPLAVMFSRFLRLDLDGTGCSACSSMFQFLYALHFDFEKKL